MPLFQEPSPCPSLSKMECKAQQKAQLGGTSWCSVLKELEEVSEGDWTWDPYWYAAKCGNELPVNKVETLCILVLSNLHRL